MLQRPFFLPSFFLRSLKKVVFASFSFAGRIEDWETVDEREGESNRPSCESGKEGVICHT